MISIWLLLVWFLLTLADTPIKCINFYGLETDRAGLVCDWMHSPEFYIDILQREMDINTVRLPFSYQYSTKGDLSKMEDFIKMARSKNIQIILDYHRTWSSHQGPTPEEGINMQTFINAWIHLLQRFHMYDNVMGVGIFNEIQSNDVGYTIKMHEMVISEIEKAFPNRYKYFAGCPQWGGDCEKIDLSHMPTWNRTFIEIHKYHFSGTGDRHDWEVSIPRRISPDHWFVGETGWKHNIPHEREWATTFIGYLKEREIQNVCYWTIAHSGDTDGWFFDDCTSYNYDKSHLSKSLWEKRLLRVNPG
jgi:hypothetical protein